MALIKVEWLIGFHHPSTKQARKNMIATVSRIEVSASRHIKRLSSIVFPQTAKERLMAMFTAYFDESGTHKTSPVIVVAGHIGTDEQWAKFNDEWQSVLRQYNLEYFHMSEFESRFHNPNSHFKHIDRLNGYSLLHKLTTIIKLRARTSVAGILLLSAYNELLSGADRHYYGQPYTFCTNVMINAVYDWAEENGFQEPIAFVFEQGARHRKEMEAAFRKALRNRTFSQKYRLGPQIFDGSHRSLPLQAADMWAYELFKDYSNSLEENPRRRRETFKMLLKLPRYERYLNYEGLKSLLEIRRK